MMEGLFPNLDVVKVLIHIVNKENGTAEMYILGGINGDNKRLKDVWKAKFSFTDDDLPMVQWEYLNIIQ